MIYYNIEFSSDLSKLLKSSMESHAGILCGDMQNLFSIINDAYQKRTGEPMPQDMVESTLKRLADLQLIGWGTAYGESYIKKHQNEDADALFDCASVLNTQILHDEEGKPLEVKEKYSIKHELCRIIRRVVSTCNRSKQLRVFFE